MVSQNSIRVLSASEGDPSNGQLVKDFQKVMQSLARGAGETMMKRQVDVVAPHIDGHKIKL